MRLSSIICQIIVIWSINSHGLLTRFTVLTATSPPAEMKVLSISLITLWVVCMGNTLPREMDSDGLHVREMTSDLSENFDNEQEMDAKFWYQKSAKELERKKKVMTKNRAVNVILFMGDGMSVPTLAAARIYQAQQKNIPLTESSLSFENFLFSGFSRTYCVDKQVADSACSATAYLGGSKGNLGTIGVTGRVKRGDAKSSVTKANMVDSIAVLAQAAGKATGFVTNTRVTHASPAGTYAHIADRDWESDADMKLGGVNPNEYDDIAEQLIQREPGRNFNVIMGGGRSKFIPKTEKDPEGKVLGSRLDGVNLINKWLAMKNESKAQGYKYVWNRNQLLSLKETPNHLLGLFAPSHMSNHVDNSGQPTLEEMTEKAISVLQKAGGKKGFFLFVEGGRIDMAHHTNQAQISLDETIEFSKAIAKAANMTKEEDTLIVVTADHAHTMSMSGYPPRSESIFGFAGKATDGLVYTTLSYANGPGYKSKRTDLSKEDTNKPGYVFPATVPLLSETHGGDDVAVFARGPNAQLFSGSYEQSFIPYAMGYVASLKVPNQ